ncbi:MAG: DUF4159 domain-containing protein [Rhodobacterales bacterium]|nr:DUF4159 domain-containing protein [Rhodobacterales bacterium]MDX5500622.1 DUF4159 domain-containing protein [Rhodobacterales bacterium]
MWVIGPIGFTAPLILWALAALPVLWWLLRAVPPAPVRRRFPGVALLLGLRDDDAETDRTPWWLLLLRIVAMAALILAFAGPVLNPVQRQPGSGPLLVLLDGSWADARDWPRRAERIAAALEDAGRQGRPVAVALLADPPAGPLVFQAAAEVRQRLPSVTPTAWEPGAAAVTWAQGLTGGFETLWISDGLDRPSRAGVLAALESRGPVRVFETGRPVVGLTAPAHQDGSLQITARRAGAGALAETSVLAIGPDPSGTERELARAPASFAAGDTETTVAFDLPPEIRNRVTRFELEGIRSAGAVALADDSLRRRKVALLSGREDREGLQLLSPTHYLRQALAPVADLIDGTLTDVLLASPDVVVLADVARLTLDEEERVADWLAKGGLLLRFAGPRLAASDLGRAEDDPLLPVRLREGGRTVGGAMSWGEPRRLAPFAEGSPFFGLPVPEEVTVKAQVLAQPDPDLGERTIATLADGTPLVTRKPVGEGQVVLFHVTANAEWSSLPLSGLFVQMLERLAVSARTAQPGAADLDGTVWQAAQLLDAFGRLGDGGRLAAVEGATLGAALQTGETSPRLPPGLYADGDRRIALNVIGPDRALTPSVWPARIPVEGIAPAQERSLKGALLAAGLLVLMADILATLALTGRLRRGVVAMLAVLMLAPPQARADDALALRATVDVVLAHVITGDARIDDVAQAGLKGLGDILYGRTTIEPAEPMGVNLETDELAFFPFLYWPVTVDQPMPSPAAYRKLNQYLRSGGMILFDTRDADVAGYGSATPEGRKLQMLAAPLDIPPLEPVPADHVLTRTFYLLQDFPGRHVGRPVWVEAAPPDAEQAEGMPFRNLNDGVTPVVIGGNDWASAWAVDDRGVPMFPVGRGFAGERQREYAWRFGVNLIMHVLTGNYKSDQVHVPALLERLGQ